MGDRMKDYYVYWSNRYYNEFREVIGYRENKNGVWYATAIWNGDFYFFDKIHLQKEKHWPSHLQRLGKPSL